MQITIDTDKANLLLADLIEILIESTSIVNEYRDKEPFKKDMEIEYSKFNIFKKIFYYGSLKPPKDYYNLVEAIFGEIPIYYDTLEYDPICFFISKEAAEKYDQASIDIVKIEDLITRLYAILSIRSNDSIVTIHDHDAKKIESLTEKYKLI